MNGDSPRGIPQIPDEGIFGFGHLAPELGSIPLAIPCRPLGAGTWSLPLLWRQGRCPRVQAAKGGALWGSARRHDRLASLGGLMGSTDALPHRRVCDDVLELAGMLGQQ